MKFSELYRDNKEAVKNALTAMWCSENGTDAPDDYSRQIRRLIDDKLFATEDYYPLVQCMDRYKSVFSVTPKEAESLVGGLWKKTMKPGKYYPPYEHQYLAWKALTNTDGPKKSMVVTTGTGSGKTECFMLPLVHDLMQNREPGKIQAIFLYPLNALMEDQKERLQALLKDTDLKFAVYNGNLPEDENSCNPKTLQEEKDKYPNILPTRKEMHATPPSIILTNPTMLEYMLLRIKDQHLFTKGSLRWIVIDETHTFSGAGAAELAMLIRRVLDAFKQEPGEIRFATSSATIGNDNTDEGKERSKKDLLQFISDITGVPKEQIEPITGDRDIKYDVDTNDEVRRCRHLLDESDYVSLKELFPNENESIEEKLSKLDALCGLEEDPLKAKVHYFYRVPNNGLRIQLDDHHHGVFNVKAESGLDSDQSPYLELMRCDHCGGYIAVGESVPGSQNEFRPLTKSGDDMFAFDDEETASKFIFGLSKAQIAKDDKNGDVPVRVDGCHIYEDAHAADEEGWRIIQNVQHCCPHCHAQIFGKKRDVDDDEDPDADLSKNALSFRIPSNLISQIIAPSILPHLHEKEKDENGILNPHKGQQYISFVDSRQAAARSTMLQNIEEERLWLYSRIFSLLNKKAINDNVQDKIASLKEERAKQSNSDIIEMIDKKIESLINSDISLSWTEIYNELAKNEELDWLAYQFADKKEYSDEFDVNNDKVSPDVRNKYLLMIMIELLGRHPRLAMAPETMGLFTTYYPNLMKIQRLPDEVDKFNELVSGEKKIDLPEWRNLLKIYLDFVVRSNQSVYLQLPNLDYDIFMCQRFGTAKPHRRPTIKPNITDKNNGSYPSVALLLAALIDPSKRDNLSDVVKKYRTDINRVLDAIWKSLTEDTELLQISQSYSKGSWCADKPRIIDGESIPPMRLNVKDISFSVIEKAWICDARKTLKDGVKPRPVDTLFMGLSPFVIGNKVSTPLSDENEWVPWPYNDGTKDGGTIQLSDIHEWASTNRFLLWENNIWGKDGIFSNRLDTIYSYPNIFVQAEHTAQVDKLVSRHSQDLFKNQKINILACSTTMEMGVDLGNLELVLMTSIPPHPTNYKQRAGRSGRNDDTRSACITLCNSDASGLRTLKNPMDQIINRPMAIPFVDRQSPQVVQRHVNAFLFRSSGLFFDGFGKKNNNLSQEVIDFFTTFYFDKEQKLKTFTIRNNDPNQTEVFPLDGLGDEKHTKYYQFLCYLNEDKVLDSDGNEIENFPKLADVKDSLKKLLQSTCYEGDINGCITRCKTDIGKVYDSLSKKVSDIRDAYIVEKDRLLKSSKPEDKKLVLGDRELRSGFGYVLRHKFSECLAENLISFLATNRFTPNANMPVDIINFNANLKWESQNTFSMKKLNNPSYGLQEALQQYAPGNTIVMENKTSVIRGIQYTGQFNSLNKKTSTFKKLYTDGNDTVIDFEKRLKGKAREWEVSGKEELTFVEPISFIPDINEGFTRVVERNAYTQVSAQLIGAGSWQGDSNSMIATRNNRDCCEAKILYYNQGIGYGYCFCSVCGKAVLETSNRGKKYDYPQEMNDQTKKDANGQTISYHYHIDRINVKNQRNPKIECSQNKILRHVILGGLIQTDYCEIQFRPSANAQWIGADTFDRATHVPILNVLGIVITRTFTEYIGKDRKDVSFAIMPNGHLCVFDTNPGGSGYSNQLSGQQMILHILKLSKDLLDSISSQDELLDRYTNRYADHMDVNGTKKLIKAILDNSKSVPDHILYMYPKAEAAMVEDIFKKFKEDVNSEKVLFVNDNWDNWDYMPDEQDTSGSVGLKQRWHSISSLNIPTSKIRICIYGNQAIPYPIYTTLAQMSGWATICKTSTKLPSPIVPVAMVGNVFYFTDKKSLISANYSWGQSDLYYIELNAPKFSFEAIDVTYKPQLSKKFEMLVGNDNSRIWSKDLGGLLVPYFSDLLDNYLSSLPQNGILTVKYQDEHLKSPLGMVVTLQLIEYFIKKFNKPFTLKFINEEYTENFNRYDIDSNIDNDYDRNDLLRVLSDEWKIKLKESGVDCQSIGIDTRRRRDLPHWRVLSFSCGGKELNIYPNGGIINEWFLDKYHRNYQNISVDDLSVTDNIRLYRKKEIMYDVEIKDK